MRSIYPILAILLLFSFTITSCNQEAPDTVVTEDDGVYTFSFDQVESEYAYRWATDDVIGLFAYESGTDEIYSNYRNKQYKVNYDNFFIPRTNDDKILRPFARHVVDFVAYHPYKANIFDKYTIVLCNQSSQKNIDFLYSNNATRWRLYK